MNMEKRTVLALVLTFAIIIIWPFLFPSTAPIKSSESQLKPDSLSYKIEQDTVLKSELESAFFEPIVANNQPVIVLDSLSHRVIDNSKGLVFSDYIIKEQMNHEKTEYVSTINDSLKNGLNAVLHFKDGRKQDLNELKFSLISSDTLIQLSGLNPSSTVIYQADVNGKTIQMAYSFYHARYHVDIKYDFANLADELNHVEYQWLNGTPYTEPNSFEDETMNLVFMLGNEDYYRFDTADPETEIFTDPQFFKYFAVRSKFFMSAVIFHHQEIKELKARAHQEKKTHAGKEHNFRKYDISYSSSKVMETITLYSGPYEQKNLDLYAEQELDKAFLNASGYENFFRWVTIPVHWSFVQLNKFVGNYGWAIVIFTILLKILTYPLTIKSYRGMKAMTEMQPKLARIKEKYSGDMMAQQQAMRQLYEEEGINPLAGCLPMLLQMPLLMALYIVFRGSIEFRGEEFLWITNLAGPDALYIGLGVIGFTTINLIPILMAISQIFMSRQTTTDPSQKMLVYLMPAVMLFMFYNWSAAINFYYFLFNVLTAVQQHYIKKPERDAAKKEKEIQVIEGFKLNEKSSSVEISSSKKQMFKKKKS